MAYREPEQPGRLVSLHGSVLHLGEDVHAALLLLGQGDRLPGHSPRVTDSLTRYGVTNSLTYYKPGWRA